MLLLHVRIADAARSAAYGASFIRNAIDVIVRYHLERIRRLAPLGDHLVRKI